MFSLNFKMGFEEGQECGAVIPAHHWLDENVQSQRVAPGGCGVRGQHWPGGHHAR